MTLYFTCNSLGGVNIVSEELLSHCKNDKIFLFYGELGSGKTTFIKSICKLLGVKNLVTSPTFSIVNEYKNNNETIYHLDFYRLKNINEAYDIGLEEYFSNGSYCFVEWPSTIEKILPVNAVKIFIENIEGKRILKIIRN